MDYYLLPIFFKKLFHLSCLEIWLSRANDIIVKLLKWPRARQGARKVLVDLSNEQPGEPRNTIEE